jgi:hypothetical protein
MATSSTALLHLVIPASRRRRHLVPRAAHSESAPPAASVDRRRFIAHTAAAAAVSPLVLPRWTPAARADEAPALSEWERIFLPIDSGVVLLDIAFVPDDPSHGMTALFINSPVSGRAGHASNVGWLTDTDRGVSGFLLGTRQTILETKDGGNTWFPRSIPSAEDEDFNYRFNSVSFKGREGWIIGKPAILLHTSDAGESWERIPLSAQLPGNMVIGFFSHLCLHSIEQRLA